jgi:hypothetical protein
MFRICLAALLVLGACSDDDDDGNAEPTTTIPAATTTTGGPTPSTTGGADPVPVLDWDALPEPAVVVEGWEVGHCEGDAPLLCVGRPGGRPGVVETQTFASADDLDAFAAAFVASARTDREAGCPPGSTFEEDEPVDLEVGGEPGVRVGFRVTLADGTLVEHGVTWAREEGDGLRVVGATGLHLERGCLEPIGEFAIEDFAAVDDLLDRLVATSRF